MTVLRDKVVTTRKEHQCYGCATIYAKGSMLRYIVSADEGELSAGYWCQDCDEYFNAHRELWGEPLEFGELAEDVAQWRRGKNEQEETQGPDSSGY